MKRCPTCDKTFDDNMRFCQADGTPLVEDVAPVDPYKTMLARPEHIAAAAAPPAGEAEDVLDLPAESDPAKTMYASEDEIRAEMAARDAGDEQVIDIPPLIEPEPPRFSEPSPPPSPFSTPGTPEISGAPIPSPFDESRSAAYEPPPPPFAEPEPVKEEPAFNPFTQPSSQPIARAEWTPPPTPDAAWQNQQIGQNTPFQPPAPGTGSVNQTLPIVSLVFGIVSLCCYISPITGIVALVTGFMGMKNANNDPQHYGGKGLAIAGMITGGVFLLIGLLYWIYIIFVVGLAALGSMGGLG
jgi:hypothetical protein